MIDIKYRRIIWGILIIIGITLYYFFTIKPTLNSKKEFIQIEYSGKISEIQIRNGYRGFPHVKIDNEWLLFGINESPIISYLQVGDSIVKHKGTDKIIVYRKGPIGTYFAKEF